MADSYSRAAVRYERYILPTFLPMAQALVRALDVPRGARVLDLATGGGAVLDALKMSSSGFVVAGDFAIGALGSARQRHPDIGYVLLDLESELPFADSSFDIVTCSFGLNHLADPCSALSRCRALVKDNGRVGFTSWQESSASPLGDLYDDVVEELVGKFELEWEPDFDEMIEDSLAALRTRKGIEGLLIGAGYRSFTISRRSLKFDFPSPRDYVDYRLAWGTDAELVTPLGPDAAQIIADALTTRITRKTPLSWTRHYFVATGR
jgi:demethylmenaquinone methyltransferase/2-methoxy-6-polyprenyl-1,4-benzoquinol methylase